MQLVCAPRLTLLAHKHKPAALCRDLLPDPAAAAQVMAIPVYGQAGASEWQTSVSTKG